MRRLTNVLLPALGDPIIATLISSESAGMSGCSKEIAVCSAIQIKINFILLTFSDIPFVRPINGLLKSNLDKGTSFSSESDSI